MATYLKNLLVAKSLFRLKVRVLFAMEKLSNHDSFSSEADYNGISGFI